MKIRTPYYYKQFRCIDKECTDTCCAGWEVDVDEESFAYYDKVTGTFGDRIQSVMFTEGENHGFTLTADKRCPFLNDKNLCDLYVSLGEDKLCETCAEFPRFKTEFGMRKEIGIALSCKTAGELILKSPEKVYFVEEEDSNQLPSFNDIEYELYIQMMPARETAYAVAQNRELPIGTRMQLLLLFASELQEAVDEETYEKIEDIRMDFENPAWIEEKVRKLSGKEENAEQQKKDFQNMMEEFRHLEVINEDWTQMVERIYALDLDGLDARDRAQKICQFHREYEEKKYEFEHLMVYFIYRYFMHTVFDYDVLSKMKIAAVSFLVIQEMDVAWWLDNGKIPDLTAQVDLMHLYSRELEHSDENFEKLTTLFAEDERFSTETLISLFG